MKYKPGIVMGGKHLVHDCGLSRSIGYFLEPLIVLGLFGKKPLNIRLRGTVFLLFFSASSSLLFIYSFNYIRTKASISDHKI